MQFYQDKIPKDLKKIGGCGIVFNVAKIFDIQNNKHHPINRNWMEDENIR